MSRRNKISYRNRLKIDLDELYGDENLDETALYSDDEFPNYKKSNAINNINQSREFKTSLNKQKTVDHFVIDDNMSSTPNNSPSLIDSISFSNLNINSNNNNSNLFKSTSNSNTILTSDNISSKKQNTSSDSKTKITPFSYINNTNTNTVIHISDSSHTDNCVTFSQISNKNKDNNTIVDDDDEMNYCKTVKLWDKTFSFTSRSISSNSSVFDTNSSTSSTSSNLQTVSSPTSSTSSNLQTVSSPTSSTSNNLQTVSSPTSSTSNNLQTVSSPTSSTNLSSSYQFSATPNSDSLLPLISFSSLSDQSKSLFKKRVFYKPNPKTKNKSIRSVPLQLPINDSTVNEKKHIIGRIQLLENHLSEKLHLIEKLQREISDLENGRKLLEKEIKILQGLESFNYMKQLPYTQLKDFERLHLEALKQIHHSIEYSLKKNNKNISQIAQCVICLDKDRCVVLLPCKHLVVCNECMKEITVCPICRRKIQSSFVVFNS